MRSAYLDYAMSVIVGRALPDVRDGLKPVHRRVLFSMSENGLGPTRPYRKSASIVGDVMGNYHPHGDTAIYDALVRLAQDFSMRYELVDGQGNFGSIDDDPPAAMRYTEARLERMAMEMLRDLDADTVDFVPNYDGRKQEPTVLPARFPNLLVNGSSGIAVGMATNIPPHNLREVISAVTAFIDNPAIETAELMRHLPGPDFPTGGIILGRQGILDAYETGRGRVRVRGKAHTEDVGRGKEAIIVTELPYAVKKGGESGLMVKIRDLVVDKKITGISNLEDHSSERGGMRIVIELKRDEIPEVVLNQLYKHTPLQTTFGVNIVALVENVPRTLSLREVIKYYVQHQREVIVRRTKHELARPRAPRARPQGPAHRARQPRRDHRAHPRVARPRQRPHRARRALRADGDPGVGDPRPAPVAAHGPRGRLDQDRARRQGRAHRRAARDPRRRGARLRDHHGGARGARRPLRRRAAHGHRRLRGRDRHRGPHPRAADGHHDHEVRLHQVAAADDVPRAAARRARRDRDGHEGRRLHRAPLRDVVARLPALLLQPRQGLPVEGLRAAGGLADGEGPRAREHPAAARGRADPVRALDARLHRGPLRHLRDEARHREEDRAAGLQHADQGRRDHRDQHPRRRRARQRAPHERRRRHPHGLAQGPGRALQGVRRARDGPRHLGRARDERRPARQRGARRWTSRATTRSCSS